MSNSERSKRDWYAEGRRDAAEGRYAPPFGFLEYLLSSEQNREDRDSYKRGYYDGKAAKSEPNSAGRPIDVRGAFLRRTDLSNANLERANLSGADFSHANLRGVNFQDAILDGTILKGADLTGAKKLTLAQLRTAIIDDETKLPDELSGFSAGQVNQAAD